MSRRIFFRNDDLGRDHEKFMRLLEIFARHELPLCAAAIPAKCQDQFKQNEFSNFQSVLEVHSHGYQHVSHEIEGKNGEFGPNRDLAAGAQDLKESYSVIHDLFGELFAPVFTPPWNRIDDKFLPALQAAGFKALSRMGAHRLTSSSLPEINVTIDWHTKKRVRPSVDEVIESIIRDEQQPIGIMLHHEDMFDADFAAMNELLSHLRKTDIQVLKYTDLI